MNLKFLLIVGTNSAIPMLQAKPDPEKISHMMVGNTFTDYYYATPSANWDRDGDGNLGEFRDDGIASYEPELYVGRIPFDNEGDVADCVSNICEFSLMTDAQRSKILFPVGMIQGCRPYPACGGAVTRLKPSKISVNASVWPNGTAWWISHCWNIVSVRI